MKKIILVLIAALILGGCQQKTAKTEPVTEGKKDVFTSIRDAVNKQLVLKCEYTDEEDGQKVIAYIKGQTVRIKGKGDQSNMDGLLKDNKFYLWDNQTKEGMELDMTKLSNNGGMKMGEKPINNTEDVINTLEEKKNNCIVSPESANLLELPSDIKFKNMSDLMNIQLPKE